MLKVLLFIVLGIWLVGSFYLIFNAMGKLIQVEGNVNVHSGKAETR